ncbi:hypothetical protein HID58_071283 [Brassica napus]|uniref:Uncharacterized protein n=1 Tax=Brassica napus TaxID=3708 RepID=A0ABQ7Z174_BRANA|nr:hypothetical protein HID58_071283 [Brassica napus]
MVRTKNMAKRDIAVTSPTHAKGESSRSHLTDEGSEATPPRNDPSSTALFPEITEELDEFNTAREKDLSEESGDQQTSSTREEVQIASVTATSSNPAPPKSQSVPLEVAGSESRRSENPSPVADSLLLICHDEKDDSGEKTKDESKDQSEPVEKVQEGVEAEGVVSLGTSSEEISEKQGRKKRVMKKLGLGTSKRLKTKGSMVTTVSSLGNYVEPVVAEFYAGLLVTKVEADAEEIEVQVRGHSYNFSPTVINERIAKAKGKAKKGGEGKLSSRSTRMPPPMPPSLIAPTPSNNTGTRRFSVHDLGSVSIPQGLLTQEDLQAVLQQTTRAFQALTDIVQDLSTCETQGLKMGRFKMYGQDGDVVVHEARHELRHQTRIPELVESVNEHSRKIY